MALKILVVDDHPMMAIALADTLRSLAPKVHSLVAHSGASAMQMIIQHDDLDLAILDLGLPDMDGFVLLARLRVRLPDVPVIVLSAATRKESVARAISAGALGFVDKSTTPARLLQAVRHVLKGDLWVPAEWAGTQPMDQAYRREAGEEGFTSRQIDVLRLICSGHSNKAIAHELGLAEKTVKGHVTAIFRVLDVVNRTQAVLAAQERGLVEPREY